MSTSSQSTPHHRATPVRRQSERAKLPPARAIKPREHGTAEDIAQRAFAEAGGVPVVADFFGLKETAVYAMYDPQQRGDLSLGRALRLTQFLGVRVIAEAFAAAAGGAFLPPAEGGAVQATLADLAALSIEDASALFSELLRDLADGNVDLREAKRALPKLDAVMHRLMQQRAELVAITEQGEGKL